MKATGSALHSEICPAQLTDIPSMREIEQAAGRRFASIGMVEVANHEPPSPEALAQYIHGRRAWIATVASRPAGYAIVDVVDGCCHLEQVSVRPDFGRRGIGRALIQTVIQWATAKGLPAVTLITFRDVPWNGPYYAALGFRPMQEDDLGLGLLKVRDHETQLGLDREARCAMRLDLSLTDQRVDEDRTSAAR